MKRLFVSFITGLLFLSVFSIAFGNTETEKRYDVPIGNSPQMGPADAPVTIIEFIDFQ
ncbi:MAG: hypothetical protein KJ555_00825 [Proteobacteria bacterium]|nr:hypothetical protein [Pseudomonadota bacterium]MBU4117291.1 hypothetical protein [Pseudomonadota bacterium]